jgi:ketosteroid isomerase-like protein
MRKLLFLTTLAGLLSLTLAAADTNSEFREHEEAWAKAVVAGDVPALENMFTDGLIYAHSTGIVENKREYLNRLKSGKQKYAHITHESVKVVPYGDAVVTHSVLRMDGISNGKPFNDHVIMLQLWVKQNGAWRIAAHQTTKLPQ